MILATLVLAAAGVTVLPAAAARFDMANVVRVVDEQPLEQWPANGRVFRFIWIPPFPSMRMFSVRVQNLGDGPVVSARAAEWTYDKQLGLVPVRIETRLERRLSPSEWDELASMRVRGFWGYRPQDYPQPFADGSVWVLEGSAWGERLRVVQHVPEASPFKTLCQRMLLLLNPRLREQERFVALP